MKRILPLGILLIFLGFQYSATAQSLDHVLGEYLIKVNPNHDITRITYDLQQFEGTETRLRSSRKLHTPWNIWIVTFDHNAVHEMRFMNRLEQHAGVAVVQLNHIADLRQTFPDDPEFQTQWQWFNDGNNGDVEDADVDAELAWDITTGGLTTDGDEIVVAVLDDGTDLSHPDLIANHWVNEGEIENNGVDDDGNGYVDDYNGWNIFNDDDDVSGGSHGVNVSGMIGAVGNNSLGVTGINWNVKIMSIKNNFATQEALVLEAYAYPYTMRKMYNETNGEEGAFVVSTNASWGIDFGDPADAPLWCAFYDDLGAEGILNCGATSNQGINIDIEGDLPTACPSDYMIAVTRTGSGNEQAGGFGPIAIDLGAPGNNIYTTNPGGGYGFTTGTSFSSPLVAGIIGLMYSSPCSNLTALAKSDPAAAALEVREYLLNNVTPVDGYDALVATGGIANAHQSIVDIMENCGPCPPPGGLADQNTTDVMADLVWSDGPNATSADLRWREVGATTWNEVSNAKSPLNITGLTACTDYEFQVINECADSMATSDYSTLFVFRSDGCCEAPAEFAVNDITDNSAVASWSSVLAAQSYNLRYRLQGTMDWTEENTTNTFFNLTGLMACSDYDIQVQTVCANELTDFTPLISFHVNGCGACEDLDYCITTGISALEFIQAVTFNAYTNESGSDDGYALFSSPTLLYNPGAQNDLTVTLGYSGTVYTENVIGWIDYNQDGTFSEEEIIINTAGEESVSGTFTVPTTALPGLTRLRIKASFQGNLLGPCDEDFEGEVEDYCIFINDGSIDCQSPENIDIAVSGNLVTLMFAANAAADEYIVEYSPTGAGMWTSFIATSNTFELPAIGDCGEFDVRVTSVCGDVISAASEIYNFFIPCPCATPASIDSTASTLQSLSVAWPTDSEAIGYEVQWKLSSETDWTNEATADNDLSLFNLMECSMYDFRIKAVCANDESDYSDIFTFWTVCQTGANNLPSWSNALTVFPNPFANNFTVNLDLRETKTLAFQVKDINGRLIRTLSTQKMNEGQNQFMLDGFENLSQGVYYLQVNSDTDAVLLKIVKM